MNSNSRQRARYLQILEDCALQHKRLSRKSFAIAMLRLCIFSATVAGVVFLRHATPAAVATGLAGLVVFLALTRLSAAVARAKDVETAKQRWAKGLLCRMTLDLDSFPGGSEHIDPSHHFSFDLDLFGKNSVFALLDSTVTPFGSKQLAEWLIAPETVSGMVSQRQDAVRELSENHGFRLAMAAAGTVASDEMPGEGNSSDIPDFSISKVQKAAVAIVPFVYVAAFSLLALDMIPGTAVFCLFLAVLLLGSLQAKRVGRLHEWTTHTIARLSCFSDVFKVIETESFHASLLENLQAGIRRPGNPASHATRRLARILHNLDQRYNVFGYAIMNGFLLWDWKQLDNIDRWMKGNGENMAAWEKAVGNFDALCALASFAADNPGYAYPVYDHSASVIMEAKAAGHPLIPAGKCVRNDIVCLRESSFFVVTGANMAGKSTYLRTVAVNFLLAEIGAPVCAEEMVFSEADLFTSLRTSDSLTSGKSYFFAELERLQAIVRQAESGVRTLVILDEILRGTNSADKQKGSIGLVRKLMQLPVGGIIATHDLALGTLEEAFPGKVRNFRFEAEISEAGSLTFSYKIQPGTARNANASFLMAKMGII